MADRWLMLALLVLARTAMGFQFQTVGSLGPYLVEALGIDYVALGTLIGLYLLPGVLIAIPGGALGGRFGGERVLLAGLALMAIGGLLMSASTGFSQLAAARLVSGTGAVLMNVAVTRMVADWFAGREIGTAMAILVSSWPLGLALGLVAVAPLAGALGWKAAAGASTLVSLAAMVAIWHGYRPAPAALPLSAGTNSLSGREIGSILLTGLIWGVYNVAYIVLVSFLPSILVARGYTLNSAAGLVSLLGWSLIAVVPLGGVLADRVRRPATVMYGGLLLTAAATILMSVDGFLLAGFIGVLLAGGLPAGALMTLPVSALREDNRALGMGLYFSCYYGCMAVLPALAGWSREASDNDMAPILFAAGLLGLGVVALGVFFLRSRVVIAPERLGGVP